MKDTMVVSAQNWLNKNFGMELDIDRTYRYINDGSFSHSFTDWPWNFNNAQVTSMIIPHFKGINDYILMNGNGRFKVGDDIK